ncbi:glycosyltransferase, family 4 [Hydrogenimonas sp.]|nr:glycosyltransferase, family 4 [Hydrogenimonas sp.]
MKKIKVFLGGYINSINAQNLNCRALAKYLDPNRFDVAALKLYSGTLPDEPFTKHIKVFTAFYPFKLSRYLAYTMGIFWADIVYLPKGELPKYTTFLTKLLKKKTFSTIEITYDESNLKNITNHFGSLDNMKTYYDSFDRLFSITGFMRRKNEKLTGIKTDPKTLYLGTDITTFLNESKKTDHLGNVIIIGNDLIRKGIYEYLDLAKQIPSITFHIVGSGNGKINIPDEIKKRNLDNIIYHGTLTHNELKNLLKIIDLHIFPSRSEGFPKVTLETAAAGVPSLVYSDYGADEWITHNKDGFVVHTLNEMEEIIKKLSDEPEKLREVSKNAIQLAKRFDWDTVIKDWEAAMEELYNEK